MEILISEFCLKKSAKDDLQKAGKKQDDKKDLKYIFKMITLTL